MLEGEINQINLVERLVEMWRELFTGAIRFESDGIIKIVYFKSGDILSASTNDRADSVDEILMRAGKVSREHVKQALARRKESETLGDALLNLGFITRKELSWARRVQVVGVIRSIAAWSTGSFTIVADYLPKRDEGTLFALPQIIVELIVTEADRQKFERVMEGGESVFLKTPSFDEVFRRLGLNEEAEQITNQIDGTQNATEVASASGKDPFNVYKLLHALATLGLLARAGKPQEVPEVSVDHFAAAGVADASDMWTTEAEAVTDPMYAAPEPPAEPVVQAQPMFDLDEAEALHAPTLEVPLASIPEEPSPSTWDDEEPPVIAAPMPTWDEEPAPVAVAEKAEQWGFDEAQIEAARRASVPLSSAEFIAESTATRRGKTPPAVKRSRFGLVIVLMVVFILAAGGYFGFLLWTQKYGAGTPTTVRIARPKPQPPVVPAAAVPATATIAPTATDSTASAATTTTSAASLGINQNTVAATTTEAPLPIVTAKRAAPAPAPMVVTSGGAGKGRERYDAMARQFLATSSGNFTVQIQILCDSSNLDKVMKSGGNDVWFVPQPIGTRSCFRVLWGRFGTREEAQRAMPQIPAGLRDPAAAVKPVPRG